jgi:hypothetical protein
MLPPPSGFSEWVTVWRDALTRPSDQTFFRISRSPNAKASTALVWVFLGSLVNFFLASLVQGPLMRQMMQNSDLEVVVPTAAGGLMTAICGAPIGALIQTVLFAAVIGVVQWIAKMFGGRGTFDQLAYAIAAIVTPSIDQRCAEPFVGYPVCSVLFGIVGLFLGIYVLVLEVTAVKGVNQFGYTAIGSLLILFFVLACCIGAGIASVLSLLAPQIMDTFNSIMTSTCTVASYDNSSLLVKARRLLSIFQKVGSDRVQVDLHISHIV